MKRWGPVLSGIGMFFFGTVMQYAIPLSHRAAWSLIIGSRHSSGWELFKPFALAYLCFIVIELACLRPSLADFVGDKAVGLLALGTVLLGVYPAVGALCGEWCCQLASLMAGAGLLTAQGVSFSLYARRVPLGAFLPVFAVFLFGMVFLVIVLTFYPPPFPYCFSPVEI